MAEDIPWHLPPNCPWYVHGDYVLDVLSSSRRTEQVQVAAIAQLVHPDEVRRALALSPVVPVAIDPYPHTVVYSIDTIVVLPDASLWDIYRGEPAQVEWPCSVDGLVPDILAADLFRLQYLLRGYPELRIDPPLKAKMDADTNFIAANIGKFPDFALTILATTPFSPWRVDTSSAPTPE